MFKFRKKREKGHEYNLTYDNLAVPEIHTHEPEDAADEDEKKAGELLMTVWRSRRSISENDRKVIEIYGSK